MSRNANAMKTELLRAGRAPSKSRQPRMANLGPAAAVQLTSPRILNIRSS